MELVFRKRKLNRLKEYDYSKTGYYFITLCTKDGIEYFGKIENEKIILNQFGKVVENCWNSIPNFYEDVEIDEFIIMPNHVHGILIIQEDGNKRTEQCSVPTNNTNADARYGLLSKVIKSFKNAVTKKIHQELHADDFQWQRSFYDHVIRNEQSLYQIHSYIVNNPLKWELEKNKIENFLSDLCSNSKK